MKQITGAIVGITLVLMSVFVPMAFFPGSVGIIYRQFSVSMIAADRLVVVPGVVAHAGAVRDHSQAGCGRSSVTPARGPFGWFNRRMEETKNGYAAVGAMVDLARGRLMLIYAAMLDRRRFRVHGDCPAGFCPSTTRASSPRTCLTPPEASFPRTLDVVKRVEDYLTKRDGVDTLTFLTGFSFLGQGQNTAQAFITLKDWSQAAQVRVGRSDRRRYQSHLRAAARRQEFRRCSRRRSTISAIPAASASACRIAASAAMRS